jgi:hypothetical protein
MPAAGKSPAPAFRKLATGQAAPALIAKGKALEATLELETMTPRQLVEAVADHERKRHEWHASTCSGNSTRSRRRPC